MPMRWSNDSENVVFCTSSRQLTPTTQPNLLCRKCRAVRPISFAMDVNHLLEIGRAFADAHRHAERQR